MNESLDLFVYLIIFFDIPDFLVLFLVQERWLFPVPCWVQDWPRKKRGSWAVTERIWGHFLCPVFQHWTTS